MTRQTQLLCVLALYLAALPVLVGTIERMGHVFAQTPFEDWVNIRYFENPWVTGFHLVPGFVMLVIAPLQFFSHIRQSFPNFHKICGWAFCLTGLISGIGVLWMVIVFPALGGLLTQLVTFVLVGLMCICMATAIVFVRRRRIAQHRAFMIRAYSIALSVSTARVFIESADIFFALAFEDTFVAASAAGVAVNLLIAEWIIRSLRN